MPTIGIFGRRLHAEVQALEAALAALGADPVIVDFAGFPQLNQCLIGQLSSFDDVLRSQAVTLDELDLVVLRPPCFEQLEPRGRTLARDVSAFHRQQIAKLSFQDALLRRMARRLPVINPPRSFRFHRLKPAQHQLLLRSGIATPSALVCSDPDRARAFLAQVGGRVVAKPLTSGAEVVEADERFIRDNAQRIRRRPFIFQQYVKGRALRAYLLGGRLCSAGEIQYDKRWVDWRERTQRITACELEPELLASLQRAVRLLELPYCGVDVEYDSRTERYYLLDFNPAALFVGYGRLRSIDMAGAIAAYLLEVLEDGCVWRAAPEQK